MASTKQATSSASSTAASLEKKGSEFLCKVKYYNSLPDIPLEPKLLEHSAEENKFVVYAATSLEKNYKHTIHTDLDLGVTINVIDPSVYKLNGARALEVEDMKIVHPSVTEDNTFAVPWLRKGTYMTAASGVEERKMDKSSKMQKVNHESSREDQIRAIEETFSAVNKDIEQFKHPTNPNLKAIEVYDIVPNEELWPNRYTQFTFDADPLPEDAELKDDAIIKAFQADNENVIAYLVPKKRKRIEKGLKKIDGHEEEYEWIKDYQFLVAPYQDVFCCYFHENQLLYVPINNRVSLMKAKHAAIIKPAKITVKYSDVSPDEAERRKEIQSQLLDPSSVQEE